MIFGKVNTSTVPEDYKAYYNHLTTADITLSEVLANYLLGLLIVLSFLLSTSLNPVVFYYNYHQNTKLKLTRLLFMMLAVSDFLANIYSPLRVAASLFSNEVLPAVRNGTVGEQVESMLFKSTGYSSMLLTALLSCCRFVNVKFPFCKVPAKLILGLYAVMQLALMMVSYEITVGFRDAAERVRDHKVYFFLYCQLVYSHSEPGYAPLLIVPVAAVPALVGFTGLFLSALTIFSLTRMETQAMCENSAKSFRQGCLAIGIMNLGNLVMSVFCVLYQVYQARYPVINFIGSCGIYILLSGLNPLVRVCFSAEIKDMMRKRGKLGTNTVSTWIGGQRNDVEIVTQRDSVYQIEQHG